MKTYKTTNKYVKNSTKIRKYINIMSMKAYWQYKKQISTMNVGRYLT